MNMIKEPVAHNLLHAFCRLIDSNRPFKYYSARYCFIACHFLWNLYLLLWSKCKIDFNIVCNVSRWTLSFCFGYPYNIFRKFM